MALDPGRSFAEMIADFSAATLVVVGRRRYQQSIMSRAIRILGIDPGLRRTGWGIVAIDGNRLGFLACGSLATDDKVSLAERLVTLHDGLRRVGAHPAPAEAAVAGGGVRKDAAADPRRR